jgi:beta-carotene 3-hydroxylase
VGNDLLVVVVVFVLTVAIMEGVAWTMHRYLMHGPLWFIHQSHHVHSDGWLELNDLYGLLFAGASIALIHFGVLGNPIMLGAGIGLLGYGLIYFLLHDVLVHKRIPHKFVPKDGYLARVVQAHHLHHATRGRDGAVSFGFVFAPRPDRLRRMLSDIRRAGAVGEQAGS